MNDETKGAIIEHLDGIGWNALAALEHVKQKVKIDSPVVILWMNEDQEWNFSKSCDNKTAVFLCNKMMWYWGEP